MKTTQNLRSISRSSQRGFGMALALAVLAIFAVIAGVISMANRGGTTKTDSETSKAMAESVVNRGNEIFSATLRGAQDRTLNEITFTNTSVVGTSWGLYDPTLNLSNDVALPFKALASGTTDTAMSVDKTSYTITGINNGANALAVTAILPNVAQQVCLQINKMINGASLDTVPPTTATTTAIREGCTQTAGVYQYYKVLGSAV